MISANLGYGPLKLDLATLVKQIHSYFRPVSIAARRFVQVFEDHGIKITQIPRILPTLTLDKLVSAEALITALDNDILRQTAEFFGIRRAWLEAADDRIYNTHWCYRAPERFVEQFKNCDINGVAFPVAVICGANALDRARPTPLALILKDKITEFEDGEIVRYRVFGDSWDWSYPRARIELKAFARVAHFRLGQSISLHSATPKEVEAIQSGFCVPWSILERGRIHDLALEDFALGPQESAKSKEGEELPYVLDYMARWRLRP